MVMSTLYQLYLVGKKLGEQNCELDKQRTFVTYLKAAFWNSATATEENPVKSQQE
jgi:hypothetical protein